MDWEALGAAEATRLADRHAIVVTGPSAGIAARVALGFGRAASATRRVAIADLAGEVPELQSLVRGDDPHGIVDSFLYGVSLNKIARQVDDRGMLFVMPTGSEPIVDADILRNDRWHRLASGFREVGALLMMVVPAGAVGLEELLAQVDGAIVVGDPDAVAIDPARVLAVVPPLATREPTPVTVPAIDDAPLDAGGTAAPTPAAVAPVAPPRRPTPRSTTPGGIPAAPAPGVNRTLILAGLLLAAIAVWFLTGRPGMPGAADPAAGDSAVRRDSLRPDSTRANAVAPATGAAAGAAASAPSESALVAKVDSLRALLPANPGDSLAAAAYGVVVLATNDETQALTRWAEQVMRLPAGTVSAVRLRGERGTWYQLQAGAFGKARTADSLLRVLRDSGVVAAEAGRVVATPFAIALESKVGRRQARVVADGYVQRQVAAYPLLQADGTATIYVGAFETPEAAAPAIAALRARGIVPTLVYRTGRSF
jgi:hypothetical protein